MWLSRACCRRGLMREDVVILKRAQHKNKKKKKKKKKKVHCGTSSIFHQCAGIAQGCPLSPFLFIIVQSVMFHDIYGKIHLDPEPAFLVTNKVLYADDTILLSSSAKNLQTLMDAVVAEGANYGLELNWSKKYQTNVNSNMLLTCPDGATLDSKRSIIYLGGLITCDGKSGTEMRRRVSEGRALFKSLLKLWSHANLCQSRKIKIFNAYITSKVLYSLESLWPLKADRNRLNAFQCY